MQGKDEGERRGGGREGERGRGREREMERERERERDRESGRGEEGVALPPRRQGLTPPPVTGCPPPRAGAALRLHRRLCQ